MKKAMILLLAILLVFFIACKQEVQPQPNPPQEENPPAENPPAENPPTENPPQEPEPEPEPSTYTVTFVVGNTTIATKTYDEGEQLYIKLAEDHYIDTTVDEYKSYEFNKSVSSYPGADQQSRVYTWATSLKTEVTSDMTVTGTKETITAIVFFDKEGGNIVDFVAQPSRIEFSKSNAPAIPEITGYEGTWEYNSKYDPVVVTTGRTSFVYPYYYSEARHTTGMPKSIIMKNGQKFWIYGKAIEVINDSGITFAEPTSERKGIGTREYGFSIGVYQNSLNETTNPTREEYWTSNALERTNYLIAADMGGIIEQIKKLRAHTGNNTWSVPKTNEAEYIGKALADTASSYLENMCTGGSTPVAYFHTINNTSSTNNAITPIYRLHLSGGIATSEDTDCRSYGYFWPISYQPIGE